jgi:sec-independent protein translocase protein TatB
MELLVILLLALLVFGPNHLPGLARNVGLMVGRVRGFVRNLSQQVEREMAAEELRKAVTSTRDSVVSDPSGRR